MEAEATTWMQRLALHVTPAGPQAEPPSISYTSIKQHLPIQRCLLDHHGSAWAFFQSLAHLGLIWYGRRVTLLCASIMHSTSRCGQQPWQQDSCRLALCLQLLLLLLAMAVLLAAGWHLLARQRRLLLRRAGGCTGCRRGCR
jgi:hypothetical protein